MIEVVLALLFLGIVSAAISGFLSAVMTRGVQQIRLSDPAIEAVVAMRRLGAIAPEIRCALVANEDGAVLWLSDEKANLAVNASEIGLLRFDAANAELLLEVLDHGALGADPTLEAEYAQGTYGDIMADFAALRAEGSLAQRVLAEGLESVEFEIPEGGPGTVRVRFRAGGYETLGIVTPTPVEEPMR